MSREIKQVDWFERVERVVTEPWFALAAGYGAVLLAVALSLSSLPSLNIARQIFVVLGVILAAWGVWMRLRQPWETPDRVHACLVVFTSAGVSFLAMFAMEESWDSGRMVLGVLTALALVGGLLVVMPQTLRRVLLSLFFIYHFVGITMAATTLPVQGEPAPWINLQLSQRCYKEYLNFMYLINAYHFYSPNPGPPQLLYFCVEYSADAEHPRGQHQWVSIPKREDFRTRLEYERRLGLTESTNEVTGFTPPQVQVRMMEYHRTQCYDPKVPGKQALMLDDQEQMQMGFPMIRKPSAYSQLMLSTYARYVATHYPMLDDDGNPVPGVKVTSVKVYRVTHQILKPEEFAKGEDPLDMKQYLAFYQGEYDVNGKLLPNDGFLYTPMPNKWVFDYQKPFVIMDSSWRFEPEERKQLDPDGENRPGFLVNRMRMHAEYFRRPQKEPVPRRE